MSDDPDVFHDCVSNHTIDLIDMPQSRAEALIGEEQAARMGSALEQFWGGLHDARLASDPADVGTEQLGRTLLLDAMDKALREAQGAAGAAVEASEAKEDIARAATLSFIRIIESKLRRRGRRTRRAKARVEKGDRGRGEGMELWGPSDSVYGPGDRNGASREVVTA